MDAFVLPSHWEGLSLALVEAMGAGRAVVATDVGGNPEVVRHGQTGLLVPSNDADTLAGALRTLATDRQLRAALGDAAAALQRVLVGFPIVADRCDDRSFFTHNHVRLQSQSRDAFHHMFDIGGCGVFFHDNNHSKLRKKVYSSIGWH